MIERTYRKGEAYIDRAEWSEPPTKAIMLPHSCDEWVIGTAKEAQDLIDDLTALIPKLTEVESIDA